MKTLRLLAVCALLSVCWSTGVVEYEAVDDHDDHDDYDHDFAEADDAPAVAGPDSSASDDSNSPSSSSSESDSSSSSSSESSESDSAASDSASSSTESSEGTSDPDVDEDAVEVLVKRDLASILLRSKRATNRLSRRQLERLMEVCELHDGCDEMAETQGIVAAYTAYYGPVPF